MRYIHHRCTYLPPGKIHPFTFANYHLRSVKPKKKIKSGIKSTDAVLDRIINCTSCRYIRQVTPTDGDKSMIYSDVPNRVAHCYMGNCWHNSGLHSQWRFVGVSLSVNLIRTDLMKSHLILNIPQQKLYSNSLMVVLNARQNWTNSIFAQKQTSNVSSCLICVPRIHCWPRLLQFDLANLRNTFSEVCACFTFVKNPSRTIWLYNRFLFGGDSRTTMI